MFVNNLWAILLAAVAAMAVGFLWYAPALFGDMWRKAKGAKKTDMQPSPMTLVTQFITEILVAVVLALLIVATGATRVSGGALIGFYAGLLVVFAMFTGWLFGDTNKRVFLIDAAYGLVVLVVMGIVLGAWAW